MMTSVKQSGEITEGHIALWTTDGVIQDGGPYPGAAQRILAKLIGANFNTTADQQIPITPTVTLFQLTGIIITNASLSLTSAVGGFYPALSKGGTPLVSAAQAYSALTTPASLMQATLAAFAQDTAFSADNLANFSIYFSLTTPQSADCTADIYLVGVALQP